MTDDELRALLAEATPGSWRYERMDCGDHYGMRIGPDVTGQLLATSPSDAALLAAAPELAAEVLRLREELASRCPEGCLSHPSGFYERRLNEVQTELREVQEEVLRLRRVLAVEGGDESAAPDGWFESRPGGWGRVLYGRHGHATRAPGQALWSWTWTKPRPRQEVCMPSGSVVVASGQAQTALEAMEAADAAMKGGSID